MALYAENVIRARGLANMDFCKANPERAAQLLAEAKPRLEAVQVRTQALAVEQAQKQDQAKSR